MEQRLGRRLGAPFVAAMPIAAATIPAGSDIMAERQADNFSTLLEQQIPRLRRYAYALHRSSRARADDLVQDTLVRAISKQHLWQPGTNLQAWLFTLMHHQNVNDVRRSIVRAGVIYNVEELHDSLRSADDTSAFLQLRDLERAMAKLTMENRQIILLVALEGLYYEDVAEVLRIPVGTVRSRLSRGRAALRRLMDMEEKNPPASRDRERLADPLTA
jgi:RNA polymerase sigma-70 factor (ECF subfamily)